MCNIWSFHWHNYTKYRWCIPHWFVGFCSLTSLFHKKMISATGWSIGKYGQPRSFSFPGLPPMLSDLVICSLFVLSNRGFAVNCVSAEERSVWSVRGVRLSAGRSGSVADQQRAGPAGKHSNCSPRWRHTAETWRNPPNNAQKTSSANYSWVLRYRFRLSGGTNIR